MSTLRDFRYSVADFEAHNVAGLADRPELAANELKQMLDSNDLRTRMNRVIDAVDPLIDYADQQPDLKKVIVFDALNTEAVTKASARFGMHNPFFAFFLDTGRICRTSTTELATAYNHGTQPQAVWEVNNNE